MQFFEIETEEGNKLLINKDYVVKLAAVDNDFKKGAVLHLSMTSAECACIPVTAKESAKVRSWLLS